MTAINKTKLDLTQPLRKIIHIDMDAFYASVEQLDNPALRGIPIAVGGSEIRGVVSAASYEARKFGVRSALSGTLARKYCPELVFVKPRFERYREISQQIREIFYLYTDLVEPLSLDEAYLDVTTNKMGHLSATLLAQEIRQKVFQVTGLTCSAGISINKFLAKIASDYNKPNGQKTINPEEVADFIAQLPIRKFYGVGKVTTDKMYHLGVFTGADLQSKSLEWLTEHFGRSGPYYYLLCRGIHHSEVSSEHTPKSIATEHTFETNLSSEVYLEERIAQVALELQQRLQKRKLAGKTITLKLKYSDFTLQTRSKTVPYFVSSADLLRETAIELLYQDRLKSSVRLLGISVTNLNNVEKQRPVTIQLKFDF